MPRLYLHRGELARLAQKWDTCHFGVHLRAKSCIWHCSCGGLPFEQKLKQTERSSGGN